MDPVGSLRDPHHQLEVLDLVEGRIEAADRVDQRAPHDEQVADVHRPQRVYGRPIGFEERVDDPLVEVELVGVGVDDVECWIRGERLGSAEQRVLGEHVVVIEERHELASGGSKRRVRRGGDPGIALEPYGLDATVGAGGGLDHARDLAPLRAVVGDAQFPVRIRLSAD